MPNAIVNAVRRNKTRWPYILIAPLGAVAGYMLAGQPGLIVATFLGPTFLAFILPNLPDAIPIDAACGCAGTSRVQSGCLITPHP